MYDTARRPNYVYWFALCVCMRPIVSGPCVPCHVRHLGAKLTTGSLSADAEEYNQPDLKDFDLSSLRTGIMGSFRFDGPWGLETHPRAVLAHGDLTRCGGVHSWNNMSSRCDAQCHDQVEPARNDRRLRDDGAEPGDLPGTVLWSLLRRPAVHWWKFPLSCGRPVSPLHSCAWQTLRSDPLERRVGTIGRPHPHVEAKIVDPTTLETVPIGTRRHL